MLSTEKKLLHKISCNVCKNEFHRQEQASDKLPDPLEFRTASAMVTNSLGHEMTVQATFAIKGHTRTDLCPLCMADVLTHMLTVVKDPEKHVKD